ALLGLAKSDAVSAHRKKLNRVSALESTGRDSDLPCLAISPGSLSSVSLRYQFAKIDYRFVAHPVGRAKSAEEGDF
ncbi:MAG TPA: hypothetical protein VGY58_03625, partial [Gemmataceae bacterium]|nr:hypothetical protein [Gemmataceae bacterium]